MTAGNLLLVIISMILIGCGPVSNSRSSKSRTQNGGNNKACTAIAAASLGVSVTTPTPNNMTIRVSVNGVTRGTYQWTSGNSQSQDFEDGTSLTWDGSKLSWGFYYETPGNYSVTVSNASGGQQTKTAKVVSDDCHVIQQNLSF